MAGLVAKLFSHRIGNEVKFGHYGFVEGVFGGAKKGFREDLGMVISSRRLSASCATKLLAQPPGVKRRLIREFGGKVKQFPPEYSQLKNIRLTRDNNTYPVTLETAARDRICVSSKADLVPAFNTEQWVVDGQDYCLPGLCGTDRNG